MYENGTIEDKEFVVLSFPNRIRSGSEKAEEESEAKKIGRVLKKKLDSTGVPIFKSD